MEITASNLDRLAREIPRVGALSPILRIIPPAPQDEKRCRSLAAPTLALRIRVSAVRIRPLPAFGRSGSGGRLPLVGAEEQQARSPL